MNDLSLTILPETPDDALAIERLHERTFGPGRFAHTAYRIRERMWHTRSTCRSPRASGRCWSARSGSRRS